MNSLTPHTSIPSISGPHHLKTYGDREQPVAGDSEVGSRIQQAIFRHFSDEKKCQVLKGSLKNNRLSIQKSPEAKERGGFKSFQREKRLNKDLA